jgi:hypothetical protein
MWEEVNDMLRRADPNLPIYGELLEKYAQDGESIAGLIQKHGLEVRDFVLLSVICNQGITTTDRLVDLVSLGSDTTMLCLARLTISKLIRPMANDKPASTPKVRATQRGMLLASRLDDDITEIEKMVFT